MTIKEQIRYQSEDGVSHPSLEAAVAWERNLMVQNHLVAHHRALQIVLADIETFARVICDTQEAVAKLFAADLHFSTGGTIKSDPNKPVPAFMPRGEAVVLVPVGYSNMDEAVEALKAAKKMSDKDMTAAAFAAATAKSRQDMDAAIRANAKRTPFDRMDDYERRQDMDATIRARVVDEILAEDAARRDLFAEARAGVSADKKMDEALDKLETDLRNLE